MKVKDYLALTVAKRLQFLTGPGRFEKINAVNGKWGEYSYPPEIRKWLDSEIIKVFVMSDGSVRIHTKPN